MSFMRNAKWTLRVAVTLLTMGVMALVPAGSADAAPGDITCNMTLTAEFKPPVDSTPDQTSVHVFGPLAACTGRQSGATGLTGNVDANVQGEFQCGVTGVATGNARFDWDGPGATSHSNDTTMTLQISETGVALALDGTINSGTMTNDRFQTVAAPTQIPNCLFPGGELESITVVAPITFA